VSVCAHGDTERASQTEISELEHAVAVNKQILRLEVAVQHTVRMAEGDTLRMRGWVIGTNTRRTRRSDAFEM
jgi:hypothetical protein